MMAKWTHAGVERCSPACNERRDDVALFEHPWETLPDGNRILQVHSRGYKEMLRGHWAPIFSPYGVQVRYGAIDTSLEDLFQCVRIFKTDCGGNVRPRGWREARTWLKAGKIQTCWHFGKRVLPIMKAGPQPDALAIDDPGIAFYVALWSDFLKTREGRRRLEIARSFDDFCDPFKGPFPFGQEEVWRLAVRRGPEALEDVVEDIRQQMLTRQFK